MTKKIFGGMFVSCLAVFAATVAIIMGVLYNYFNNQLKSELLLECDYVAAGTSADGESYLDSIGNSKTRITWVASDGTVLFDNQANASEMENHRGRKEIEQALETGNGESVRYSATLSEKTVYRAKKLDDGTVIRVSGTQISFFALLFEMLRPLIFVFAIVLAVSLVLSYRLSKQIVKPLNGIDLEKPENADVYDELSPMLSKISRQNHLIDKQIKQLRRKTGELETITANMNEGLVMTDTKAQVLLCNDSARKLLGTRKTTSDAESVFTLNRTPEFRKPVEEALAGSHSENVISDSETSIRVIANPVYDDGNVAGVVIVILDETEKEKREQLRREFTSNVSHELKTPLTSISGFAELIRNGMTSGEDTIHFADNIYNESKRLITLAEDIIKLSQLDEGSITGGMEKLDLFEIAKSEASRLESVAEKINVGIEISGENAYVTGNEKILGELVYNLCDNAVKYNKNGGKVYVSVNNSNKGVELCVKDTGIGIPKEHQQRVFERFYRVDKSHSKETGGTGLGLSIVKHACLIHNAHLELESIEDVGTTVTVTFNSAE